MKLDIREKKAGHDGGQTTAQVAQRNRGLSVLGDTQK